MDIRSSFSIPQIPNISRFYVSILHIHKKKVHDHKFKHEIAFPLYPHGQTREDTEWLKPQVLIKKTVHLNISYRCAFFWCGIHLISKSRIDSTAQDYRNYDTETLWNSHIKLLQSVESESNKYITALYL